MIDHIVSLIQDLIGPDDNNVVSPAPRHFSELAELSGITFVISKLSDAVSLPLRVRRIQYEFSEEDTKIGLDFLIESVIDKASQIIALQIGEQDAEKWARDTNLLANRILAGRGPLGLLSGRGALVVEESKEEAHEVIQTLRFRFHDGRKPIATRTHRYTDVPPLRFDDYEPKVPEYAELLASIQSLRDKSEATEVHKFHHLYLWSDLPASSFQPSFVERIVTDYVRRYRGHHIHTAKILIIASSSCNEKAGTKSTLDSSERLALQRGFGDGILYLAPGKEIFTGPYLELNRPHSVLDSRGYSQDIGARFKQLGLENQRITRGLRPVVHESTVDLIDTSAFAILSDCWTGTWAESKEVDGEQVMS